MKIIEDTPSRLVVHSRRRFLLDIALMAFLVMGVLFSIAIASGEMTPFTALILVLTVGFAVIGVWGLLANGAATATLDAVAQELAIARRSITGTKIETYALTDIVTVRVHEDDDMHTIGFELAGGGYVRFENAFTGNTAAFEVAKRVRFWLEAAVKSSAAT